MSFVHRPCANGCRRVFRHLSSPCPKGPVGVTSIVHSMPTSVPTHAEYAHLKGEFEALRAEVEGLKEHARQQRAELQIQFKRIAEIQAILDEERLASSTAQPRP